MPTPRQREWLATVTIRVRALNRQQAEGLIDRALTKPLLEEETIESFCALHIDQVYDEVPQHRRLP